MKRHCEDIEQETQVRVTNSYSDFITHAILATLVCATDRGGTAWFLSGSVSRPHLYAQVVHLFHETLPLVHELVLSVEQLHHLLSAGLTVLVQLLQSAHNNNNNNRH